MAGALMCFPRKCCYDFASWQITMARPSRTNCARAWRNGWRSVKPRANCRRRLFASRRANSCRISRSRLRRLLHAVRRTKADRKAAHQKSDQRRDDLCAGGLRGLHTPPNFVRATLARLCHSVAGVVELPEPRHHKPCFLCRFSRACVGLSERLVAAATRHRPGGGDGTSPAEPRKTILLSYRFP